MDKKYCLQKKFMKTSRRYRQIEYCRVSLTKQFTPQKESSWTEIDRRPDAHGTTSIPIELDWHLSQAVHCIGSNNCSELDETSSKIDNAFPLSSFRLYSGLKLSFHHNMDVPKPKIQDLVESEKDEWIWNCSSYSFRNKTKLHCAEREAKLRVNETL